MVGRNNPWSELPRRPPYVLPADAEIIARHPKNARNLHLELLPLPFIGNPAATRVLLLNTNPGFSLHDIIDEQNLDFAQEAKASLVFASKLGFHLLDPAFSQSSGARWWKTKLAALTSAVQLPNVLQHVACVEWFPYHSEYFHYLGELLPSQQFSFDLVREAVIKGTTTVVMRAYKKWVEAVPELASSDPIRLRNPQNVSVSPGNMQASEWTRLTRQLQPDGLQ